MTELLAHIISLFYRLVDWLNSPEESVNDDYGWSSPLIDYRIACRDHVGEEDELDDYVAQDYPI